MTNIVVLSNISALRAFSGGSASPAVWIGGYDSPADGGEGAFIYVAADTASADNYGTIILDTKGNRYYRECNQNPCNICWFGGKNNGVADNYIALSRALAALPAGGGQIFFPPGKYVFSANIIYDLPSGPYSICFTGAGADVTILYWSASSGITLNANSADHSIHFRDMTISCGSNGFYTGIAVNNSTLLGVFCQSDFVKITFRGDNSGLETYGWATGLKINGLSNVSYNTLLFNGHSGTGVGISVSGNGSISPYYSIVHNITNCGFFGLQTGFLYGSYVQGVTVSQCNFTNGVTGISTNSGELGLTQLAITDSQFNNTGNQIIINTPITSMLISGNVFYVTANNTGILIAPSGPLNQSSFIGNNFNGISQTGSTAIDVLSSSTASTVIGNSFYNLNVGVNLTPATGWNVQANVYSNVVTKVFPGTGNSVGVATE